MGREHRNTLFVEDTKVVSHERWPGDQFILRLQAPHCASRATPGSFAHIRCEPGIPMRRPLSIMRASATEGWIEFLYKIHGGGLQALSQARSGDTLSIIGPIGNGFSPDVARPVALLLGGGVGIPPVTFLAERLRSDTSHNWQPVAFLGSELPFPFPTPTSDLQLNNIPTDATACMPLLESLGIPSRLASLAGYAGCHKGYVTDLARAWLQGMSKSAQQQVEIHACGPEPMLRAAAALAADFALPAQLCLEEYMACAVGGCAGCAVPIHSKDGVAMKRVCVDGPVFTAQGVYPK